MRKMCEDGEAMPRAELKQIELRRFKSHQKLSQLEVAPLTVLLGRNNSGKSSLIQALLLLRQTLAHPRNDVPLHLEGAIDALNLRELTSGWPDEESFAGPVFRIIWDSDVSIAHAMERAGNPDIKNLAKLSQIKGLTRWPEVVRLRTRMRLGYQELEGRLWLPKVTLNSWRIDTKSKRANPALAVRCARPGAEYSVTWNEERARKLTVELEHFLPFLDIDRRNVGPRNRERSWFNGYLVLYEQPLDDLRRSLERFVYLGSMRTTPPSIYRPASVPPEDIGMSGEFAAQMLHSRQKDIVHYMPPIRISPQGPVEIPNRVSARPLVEAVNDVMGELGIYARLRIEDLQNIGFRLLFGDASLQHVGRGLGYLLPVVQLGLIADPHRFDGGSGESSVEDFEGTAQTFTHVAIEEPETHLHPKVQTRLAHWLVSLAMTGRRLIIETHSDHLVRRLRGLIARAEAGSELERWLEQNVVIAEVEQDENGESTLTCSHLTAEGRIEERWPHDFMDEASEEERAIYYAGLDKQDEAELYMDDTEFIHDPPSPAD